MSLLSPAAPEASACSAAGIRWALEDLVASCLHHRQWHEVQARSKLAPACLGLPVCACPPACLLHMKSVFVTGYALCLFSTSCVYSDSQDCSCLLYMKSVFVTGYALCHFPISCVFPRPWPPPVCLSEAVAVAAPCDFPRPWPWPPPVCLSEAEAAPPCVFPRPRPRTRTRTPHQHTCRAGAGPAIRT